MRSGLVLRSAGVCALAVITLGSASVESRETAKANSTEPVVAISRESLASPTTVPKVKADTQLEPPAPVESETEATDAGVALFTIRPTG
ncbi:MAG TPA: hypothetical protein VIT19_08875, partial [Pyrinomonadaceae bacterium]